MGVMSHIMLLRWTTVLESTGVVGLPSATGSNSNLQ